MKNMSKLKAVITVLVAVCVLCAVAAFFLPNAHGMVLSYVAIAAAIAVAVIGLLGMLMVMINNNRNAAV